MIWMPSSRWNVLLLLVVSYAPLCSQQADEQGMSLGVDSIHTTGDVCLMLGAKAVARDFFKGLRARETREGRTFQEHGRAVKFFPGRITVKIEAVLDRCVRKGVPDCDRCDLRLNAGFMDSLQFEANWKHGFETQKADVDFVSVEQSNDLGGVAPSAKVWKYELSVKSKDVPLTDSLAVVIITPSGRIVSRLSGRL
jgi:hypothetical protein